MQGTILEKGVISLRGLKGLRVFEAYFKGLRGFSEEINLRNRVL